MRAALGGSFEGKTVGVLGLAFKPNTDDMRDAKSVEIIGTLLAEGANVKTYDPIAMDNVRRIYGERRAHLLDLMECRLTGRLSVVPSFYGMHIGALARDGIDCEAVSVSLAKRGVMIHSLDRYFLGPATRSGFVIGYAAADLNELETAIGALAEALAETQECQASPH
jgi:DNA-binding transcriptional MocR family regulator